MKLGHGTVDGLPFLTIEGASPTAGWGSHLITYTVYIEEQIEVKRRDFARKVESILADERGWIRGGTVSFKRVNDGDNNTSLVLATPPTTDKLCYPLQTEGEVSCCQGTKVCLNSHRWKQGVPHWTGTLNEYRTMLVNHEFGHRVGKPHRWCQKAGEKAAVMQQQTYSLQTCLANEWPLDSEL